MKQMIEIGNTRIPVGRKCRSDFGRDIEVPGVRIGSKLHFYNPETYTVAIIIS